MRYWKLFNYLQSILKDCRKYQATIEQISANLHYDQEQYDIMQVRLDYVCAETFISHAFDGKGETYFDDEFGISKDEAFRLLTSKDYYNQDGVRYKLKYKYGLGIYDIEQMLIKLHSRLEMQDRLLDECQVNEVDNEPTWKI